MAGYIYELSIADCNACLQRAMWGSLPSVEAFAGQRRALFWHNPAVVQLGLRPPARRKERKQALSYTTFMHVQAQCART